LNTRVDVDGVGVVGVFFGATEDVVTGGAAVTGTIGALGVTGGVAVVPGAGVGDVPVAVAAGVFDVVVRSASALGVSVPCVGAVVA